MKICFASSSGGHFQQLMKLKPLMNRFDSFILTEQTKYQVNVNNHKLYYVSQIQRKEKLWVFKFFMISFISLKLFLKEKPDVVISTGVLATIPMCLIAKLFRKKIIYIESFAKSDSPTLTGRVMSKIADDIYVQWDSMLKFYKNAKCLGSIY
jgi:beta-1,4-N-acetylglucosaminyltransferase